MPRVGTCQECGARFKVPETTTKTKAKCSKCGGVVVIPPAGDGGGASEPAAAPAGRKSAAASGRSGAKRASAGGKASGAKSGGRGRSARGGGGGGRRSGGGRGKRGGSKEKSGAPVGAIVAIIIVVVGLGAGAYFMFFAEEAPPPAPAETTTPEVEEPTPAAEPEPEPEPEVEVEPLDTTGLEKAKAPTVTTQAVKVDPDIPLDPVLAHDVLPACIGTTEEDLTEWTDLVKEIYLEAPPPRIKKKLDAQLAEVDVVVATPAYINALIGLDMSTATDIRDAHSIVKKWQDLVGNTPTFAFNGEITETDQKTINNRVTAINNWIGWWVGRSSSQESLDEYRLKMEERLREKQAAGEEG